MFEFFLIAGLIVVYFLLMFFYPEWVGMSGKVAKRNEKDHQKGTQSKETDFFKK